MLVIGTGLLLLTAAAVMPNLYIEPLVDRYYEDASALRVFRRDG